MTPTDNTTDANVASLAQDGDLTDTDTDPDYVPEKKRRSKRTAGNNLQLNKTIKKSKIIRKKIINPEYKNYTDDEKQFFNTLAWAERKQIAEMEQLMKELNEDHTPLRFKVLTSDIEEKIKSTAIQKMNHLNSMDPGGGEYHKITHWIESVCRIPFGKYKALPVNAASEKNDIRGFLIAIKDRMDSLVYGHKNAKEHIVRLLAQWISKPDSKGMVLGIHGPAGCGKCHAKDTHILMYDGSIKRVQHVKEGM